MSSPYRDASGGLGALVSVHRDGTDGCLTAALLVCGLGASVAFGAIRQWTEVAAALAATAFGVAVLRRKNRKSAGSIALHDNGLVQVTAGETTTVLFDDVVSITSAYTKHVKSGLETATHRIAARDGSTIELTRSTAARADDLIAAIEARVLPRVRTEALQAFDRGETVSFGPFSLDDAGIRADDGAPIAWKDVRRVTDDGGMIHIRGEGDRVLDSRGASLIPNLAVFREMVELAAEQERSVAGAAEKDAMACRESLSGSD